MTHYKIFVEKFKTACLLEIHTFRFRHHDANFTLQFILHAILIR